MNALWLAVALAAANPAGLRTRLPPVPVQLYRVAWQRPFVAPEPLESHPLEAGGPAVGLLAEPKPGPGQHVVVVGTKDGWLHALRPDGTLVWEVKAGGGFAAAPTVDGDTVYAGSQDGKLYAVALGTGVVRWSYDTKEELGTRPLVVEGSVFVASLADTLFAIDKVSGAWKWHHRRDPHTKFTIRGAASPVAHGELVFGAYSDGFVAALDQRTGEVKWEKLVAPPGEQLDVDALRVEGDRLFAAAYSGAVLGLDVATGNVAWTARAPGASRLAVAGGRVIAVTPGSILALSTLDGRALWTVPLVGAPTGDPVILGRYVAVPAGEGGLRFLEGKDGTTLRVLDPGTGVSSEPAAAGGRFYVLSNGGALLALDLVP